jgi:hypothetical protein
MSNTGQVVVIFFFAIFTGMSVCGQNPHASKTEVILSAVKGSSSKPDTIQLHPVRTVKDVKISGDHKHFFTWHVPASSSENKPALVVVFSPPASFTGIARAVLSGRNFSACLTGLSTKGLEGENEPPLAVIIESLGYSINTGWTTLPNNLSPTLHGDELPPSLFKKTGTENIEMIPVARYSPDFAVNFGYYIIDQSIPRQNQVGILATAKGHPEHQILFPGIAMGSQSFDPGTSSFGFYAISPTHTVYSEDIWNVLFHPGHAGHGMRIYPVRDKMKVIVPNTFLVCMEEAKNGDYNDYVFLVKNVTPMPIEVDFKSMFNGKNLDGWYKWLKDKGKNNDPANIFSVVENGVLHDMGTELGYIMSEKSFGNYHFVLDFKWGEKKWAPRDKMKRDSGICYNIPEDEPDSIWPQSVECQIQEGDVGDFWLLNYSTIQVDGKQNSPLQHSQIVKKVDAEKPNGEWNTVEVISVNGKCAHIVNGTVVNYGENSSLIGGRILLQSEYAELYFRNIRIREL